MPLRTRLLDRLRQRRVRAVLAVGVVAGAAAFAAPALVAPTGEPVPPSAAAANLGWQAGLTPGLAPVGEVAIAALAPGDTADPAVRALVALPGGEVAAAGWFDVNGTSVSLARFSPSDGTWIPVAGAPSEELLTAGTDIDGGVYLAGVTTMWRWKPVTGEIVTVPSPGPVRAFATGLDGTLYVAGEFDPAVAELVPGTGWVPLGAGPGGRVNALTVAPDGRLFAAGSFAGRVTVFEPATATWAPLGAEIIAGMAPGPAPTPTPITSPTATTVPIEPLASIQATPTPAPAPASPQAPATGAVTGSSSDPVPSPDPAAAATADPTPTTLPADPAATDPATVTPTTAPVTTPAPTTPTTAATPPTTVAGAPSGQTVWPDPVPADSEPVQVYALTVTPDGTLWAGGSFEGTLALARYDGAGWTVPAGAPDGVVRALTPAADGKLYVGGVFPTPGANIASVNPATGEWFDLASGVAPTVADGTPIGTDGPVYTLVSIGATLQLAGSFTNAGGQPAEGAATYLTVLPEFTGITPGQGGRDGGVVTVTGTGLSSVLSGTVADTPAVVQRRTDTALEVLLPPFEIPARIGFTLGPVLGPSKEAVALGPVFNYREPVPPLVDAKRQEQSLTLSWAPVFGASRYRVQAGSVDLTVSSNGYVAAGIAPGTRLPVSVASCDSFGCGTTWTDSFAFPLDTPRPELGSVEPEQVRLFWAPVDGASRYQVTDGAKTLVDSPSTEFTDVREPGSVREYQVIACSNDKVCSNPSPTLSVRTPGAATTGAGRGGSSTNTSPSERDGPGSRKGSVQQDSTKDKNNSDALTSDPGAPATAAPSSGVYRLLGAFIAAGALIGVLFSAVPWLRRRKSRRTSRLKKPAAGPDGASSGPEGPDGGPAGHPEDDLVGSGLSR